MEKVPVTTARFWVETLFLFIVLIFSMVQLVLSAEDRPVYFTLISGICGKIAKLKVKRMIPDSSKGSGAQNKKPSQDIYEEEIEDSTFDDIDGRSPDNNIASRRSRTASETHHTTFMRETP